MISQIFEISPIYPKEADEGIISSPESLSIILDEPISKIKKLYLVRGIQNSLCRRVNIISNDIFLKYGSYEIFSYKVIILSIC